MSMINFYHKSINYLVENSWLDHWTAFHIAAGAFICKLALLLGASNLWAVLWVVIFGVIWEIVEWYVENWKPYGTKSKWLNNTISDLIVEIGIAVWIVI